LIAIHAGGFVCVIFSGLVGSFLSGLRKYKKNPVALYAGVGGALGAVWIGMGVMIIVYNNYADNQFAVTEDLVRKMTFVNGCSDAFTKINADG